MRAREALWASGENRLCFFSIPAGVVLRSDQHQSWAGRFGLGGMSEGGEDSEDDRIRGEYAEGD